ncbi:hypothetical protein K8R33_00705 [archaeon]|nr:hypothetical protein [archaeon]
MKEYILSNEEFNYQLEEFAVPGSWKIVARGADLKVSKEFEVQIVEKLDIGLSGQTLEIINLGNMHYSQPLVLVVDNGTILEKRTNLDPGESLSVVLYKEVKDGMRKVYVENTGQTVDIEVVDHRGFTDKMGDFFSSVTGQAVRKSGYGTSNIPFLILIGLVVGLLVFVSVELRKRGKGFKLKKPKFRSSAKNEDVEQIRDRILQDIKSSGNGKKDERSFAVSPIIKQEDKVPPRMKFDEPMRKDEKPKENNSKNNLFKMFD